MQTLAGGNRALEHPKAHTNRASLQPQRLRAARPPSSAEQQRRPSSGAMAAPRAFMRPAAPAARRLVRAAADRGTDGQISQLLNSGLSWLNWDVSRAYGSGGSSGATTATSSSPTSSSSSSSSTATSSGTLGSRDDNSSMSDAVPTGSGTTARIAGKDPAKHARIRQAFADGSLAFGFSAGGLMFPYYVGVVSALEEMGVLKRQGQLAGASAGSLVAAAFNSGLDM
jgi:hypothetical protein